MVKIDPSSRSNFNHGVEKKRKAKNPTDKKMKAATKPPLEHASKTGGKPLMKRVSKEPKGNFSLVKTFATMKIALSSLAKRITGIIRNPAMASLVRAALSNPHKTKTTIRSAIVMKPSARATEFAKNLKRQNA